MRNKRINVPSAKDEDNHVWSITLIAICFVKLSLLIWLEGPLREINFFWNITIYVKGMSRQIDRNVEESLYEQKR